MNKLNSLRVQLSKEEMKNISGGKKVTKVTYIQGAVVDCSDDYDPSRYICHERITKTLTYNQNIFGKISDSKISYDDDGVGVTMI